jgi:hypothetical protein
MTTSSEEELDFAGPDSTDLCCDIVDTVVQSVISFNNDEVMVTLAGGSGLLTVDGEPCRWDNFSSIELTGGFYDHPENAHVVKLMTDVLEEWRSNGTKLRLLSAPGKITTLIEDADNWLPIPCGTVGT